jgi:hypothetical protein
MTVNRNYLLQILEASVDMQWHISAILEAKAVEAEKSRAWICSHISHDSFPDHEGQLKYAIELHQQLLELIEGITKMENGLTRNLKTILGQNQDDGSHGELALAGFDA